MSKIVIMWSAILEKLSRIDKLGNLIYGVPKGGMIVAGFLKNAINTPYIEEANIILDDIIDSGKTMEYYQNRFPQKEFIALIDKVRNKDDYMKYNGKWIVFPWEKEHPAKDDSVQENITRILQHIGENPLREGLLGTPDRVIRMYSEIFRGYDKSQRPKIAIFNNGLDGISYDQMIIDEGTFYSHCEHHMVPFFGKYYFAYIPSKNGKIIGLSKVARIIDHHAAKLQIQERLVHDIIEDLWQALSFEQDSFVEPPLGMGLVMIGEHLCKTMRGAKKKGTMTTIKLKGAMLDKPDAKAEFLQRCNI